MLIAGKCHCGNIAFRLRWEPDPTRIEARACTCTFCLKHGGVWTSHPQAALRIVVRDASAVSRYTFGTGNASFHACARCGVVPVVTSLIGGRLYAVVSVNAFEDVDPALIRREPRDFAGEDPDSRRARWQRNWIADVEYVEGGEMNDGAPARRARGNG
jgi:hypothetical protein